MNAEIACKLIAKHIDKRYPADREQVREILRMALNRAWAEGKWFGMTAEMTVPVLRDSMGQDFIVGPTSHPILLAINTLSPGSVIRDKYFQFHRNGNGRIRNSASCSWSEDVFALDPSPVLDRNNIICEGVRIGVRAVGRVGPNERVWVNGEHTDGNRVFTYTKSTYGTTCGCKVENTEVDTVNGMSLAVKAGEFHYLSDICFNKILSITKTPTLSPIEIIALTADNQGHLIARMEPNHRFSSYRKYLVPNNLCHKRSLHAIFKIGQQELITSDTDPIMISNEEALIGLAKGINLIYHKEQQEAGAGYILNAIALLDKEKREEESPSQSPVQVDGIYDGDLPEILRYHS